jgi:DNA-binding XRE family transcriptional regulator
MSHVTRNSLATRINAGLLTSIAIENPRVTGSIPVQATIFKALAAKNSQILCYSGSACACLNAHF